MILSRLSLHPFLYFFQVACHKGFYHPVSEAMVDAVTLVNLLSKLQSNSMDSLTAVFKEYKERRAPTAKAVVEHSTLLRQVFTGKVI